MANAFLVHLIGKSSADKIRGVIEAATKEEGDDEFAGFWGLV